MEFKLEDVEETFNGEIINKISNNEYLIKIQDKEHQLRILNIDSNGMEFVLDNKFHNVKYVENHTAEMRIVIDGVSLTINMHTQLDKIVYKNTGNADTGSGQINLRSQIPGKVVSVVQKGYLLQKRLIRPALVTVGGGKEAETHSSTEESPTNQNVESTGNAAA